MITTTDTTTATISRRVLCPPVDPSVSYSIAVDQKAFQWVEGNDDVAVIIRKVEWYLKKAGDEVTFKSTNPKMPGYDYRDTSTFSRRRVTCARYPDPAYEYELIVPETGEILICRDLYPLLNAACVKLWKGLECTITKLYAHGYPKAEFVNVCVIAGVEGHSLGIDDRRVAGPKPWGGGKIVHEFTVPLDSLVEALRGKVVRA